MEFLIFELDYVSDNSDIKRVDTIDDESGV